MDWKDIILAVATSSVINGLAIFFIQKWYSGELDKKLATHKSNLDVTASERNFRYSLYYKELTVAIIAIHKSIIVLHSAIDIRFEEDEHVDRDTVEEQVSAKLTAFKKLILDNRLYLNISCETQLSVIYGFLVELAKLYINKAFAVAKENESMKSLKEKLATMTQTIEANEKQFVQLFGNVQIAFQELLGFPKEQKVN